MKSAISEERIKLLHPKKIENFRSFIEELESSHSDFSSILIVQGFRSFEDQDKIYAQGRTTPGNIVTRAKGGQSWHCYGLAIDIVPIVNGKADWDYDFSKFAPVAEKYGLTWGHAWNDNDHFEDNLGHGPSGWKWALDKWNNHETEDNYIII